MNINGAVCKKYEGMSLKELTKAPVDALQGVSAKDAQLLKEAFGIDTVEDLANLKFAKWAQAIALLAECEEKD